MLSMSMKGDPERNLSDIICRSRYFSSLANVVQVIKQEFRKDCVVLNQDVRPVRC